MKQAGGKSVELSFKSNGEVLNSDYDIKNGNNPYFQWGRKDPMLPGNGLGDADKTCFTNEDQYRFAYKDHGEPLNTSEIKEYIRNPHKFNIKEEMDGLYYNLWSTDNAKTDANDELVIKSVYDPSPVGYSLPASNAFTGFTTTGQNVGSPGVAGNPDYFNVKFPFDNGWYFYTKPNKEGKTFWVPANGFRSYITGKMLDSNKYGFILTSGISTTGRERLLVISSDFVMNIIDNIKNDGISVRSAEEKETQPLAIPTRNFPVRHRFQSEVLQCPYPFGYIRSVKSRSRLYAPAENSRRRLAASQPLTNPSHHCGFSSLCRRNFYIFTDSRDAEAHHVF